MTEIDDRESEKEKTKLHKYKLSIEQHIVIQKLVWIDKSNVSVIVAALKKRHEMQYKFSIPNDRSEVFIGAKQIKSQWRETKTYQNLCSLVLIPSVIVAFWRGSWGLMDKFELQFFPKYPTLVASALILLILERIRNTFISSRLKILDGDNRATILKKNILLSIYDIIFNLANVSYWRILWGHDGEYYFIIRNEDC